MTISVAKTDVAACIYGNKFICLPARNFIQVLKNFNLKFNIWNFGLKNCFWNLKLPYTGYFTDQNIYEHEISFKVANIKVYYTKIRFYVISGVYELPKHRIATICGST